MAHARSSVKFNSCVVWSCVVALSNERSNSVNVLFLSFHSAPIDMNSGSICPSESFLFLYHEVDWHAHCTLCISNQLNYDVSAGWRLYLCVCMSIHVLERELFEWTMAANKIAHTAVCMCECVKCDICMTADLTENKRREHISVFHLFATISPVCLISFDVQVNWYWLFNLQCQIYDWKWNLLISNN